MTNSGTTELTASYDNIEVALRIDEQYKLKGETVSTNAGSGVEIPIDLEEENFTGADAELLVNVI